MIGQRIRVAWFGGALLSFIALPAMPQGNGSAAPKGSYLKTCSQIHFNGKVLMATCDNGRSRKLQSTINVTACDGDIWNKNGILYCFARRDTWGEGTAIPRGGYNDSCVSPTVSGTLLQSQCADRNGQFKETTLQLKTCRMGSNISNIDGQLVCIN